MGEKVCQFGKYRYPLQRYQRQECNTGMDLEDMGEADKYMFLGKLRRCIHFRRLSFEKSRVGEVFDRDEEHQVGL